MPDMLTGCLRVDCAAKLNLFLEVLARRADGFHEIETVMAAVDRYDSLYFSENVSERIHVTCQWASGLLSGADEGHLPAGSDLSAGSGGDLPQGADNLVWKAVDRLRREAGVTKGATIRVVKRIPTMAGLGGASADAAAALLAANRAWRIGWSSEQLAELSAELGSDLPFFFVSRPDGPCLAIARGRGERIEVLRGAGRLHVVVVRPPEGLSTPAVYRQCRPADQACPSEPLLAALAGGRVDRVGALLFNRLQPAAEQLSPWIARVRSLFERLDCMGHSMSGSGSSYFGLCRHARHARRIAARLRAAKVGLVFPAATTFAACRLTGTTA